MSERFELLDEVGVGGMGSVWRARDALTGEVIALKLLHRQFVADPDYVLRLEREVETVRRIASPHVVKVHGYGRLDGVPYVAMEYVAGRSLREQLKAEGPVGWDEAKRIGIQLASALAAAHAAGVIHRDVKPSNVLLDGDGNAKLADFGIARANDLTRLTGSVTVLGTPAYMSPDGDANEQSDLYALGCVLYEMMTGAPPFEGESQQQVLLKHIREAPKLDRLPPQARRLVGWLLEKEPRRRPASATALLAVLQGSSIRTGGAVGLPMGRRGPVVRAAASVAALVGVFAAGAFLVSTIGIGRGDDDHDDVASVATVIASSTSGATATSAAPSRTTATEPPRSPGATSSASSTPMPTATSSGPGGDGGQTPTSTSTASPTFAPPTSTPTPTFTATPQPPTSTPTPTPTPTPGLQPPNKPGPLSYCGGTTTSFCVRWGDASDNEDGFKVYMNGELAGSVGSGTTTFTVSGLIPNLTYCFAVASFNGAGESVRTSGICKNP